MMEKLSSMSPWRKIEFEAFFEESINFHPVLMDAQVSSILPLIVQLERICASTAQSII